MSNVIWIILIGFVAGLIARMLSPGPNDPKGFILTTVLGVAGAFIATFIGQTVGWYRLDQGAGLIGATIGALVGSICLEPAGRPPHHSRPRRPRRFCATSLIVTGLFSSSTNTFEIKTGG